MSVEVSQQANSTPTQSQDRSEIARLLELRAAKKMHTPKFQRQESWRYVRIHDPWRKPKGVDSHMRLSVKGWPHLVRIGYRGPKPVRGLHPSGYRDVLVHNLAELESLSPVADAARLAAGVGRKKRIEIARRAYELSIRVLNGGGLLGGQDFRPEDQEEKPSDEEKEADKDSTKESEEVSVTTRETKDKARESKTKKEKKKRPKKGQKKSEKKPSKAAKKKKPKDDKKDKKKRKK